MLRVGYLGLGSNVGDRRENLQAAVEDLWVHGVAVLDSSSVYETEPVGEVPDQPEFLNACLAVETALGPQELLAACKAVEAALGRGEIVRHGPRVIDVDVLLLGTRAYESERIAIPHPVLAARDLRYLGLIGRRAKITRIFEAPAAEGMPAECLERVRAPIGLHIGAVTPAEIAISIVAEMIAVRRGVTDRSQSMKGVNVDRLHAM